MKNTFTVILFLLTVSFTFSQNKKETIVIHSSIKCDHCMECDSCGQNIYNAMAEIKGVTDVKVNPEENTIAVTYKPKSTNPETIRKAISEAGYDADDTRATAESYAKLDGCCKTE